MKAPTDAPALAPRESLSDRARAFSTVLQEEFGIPFRFFDATTGGTLWDHDPERVGEWPAPVDPQVILPLARQGRARVRAMHGRLFELLIPFHEPGRPDMVAAGVLPALASTQPEAGHEHARLQKWAQSVHDRLRMANQPTGRHRVDAGRDGRSAIAWEAVMELEQLMRTQRIHKDVTKNRKRVLRAAAELLKAEVLIWVPSRADESILIEGECNLSPWDCGQLANLIAHNPELDRSGYLICNDVHTMSWTVRFPQVFNLMSVPVAEHGSGGCVIALNKKASPSSSPAALTGGRTDDVQHGSAEALPFRRSDAALLAPFAALLGLHLRASQRYQQLKELLVGLTRSLTAAIDAKDSYTYGHSERVARIAIELGRELGLQEDELSDIYLAGLMHDIGKIGIRDDVLSKPGPHTPEETKHVRQHVTIGYQILAGLHPISHLLPGVLYHHERYDGKGYPEGLKGDAIPFLARILAVADSFDAMSTSRPYRSEMPSSRVDQILLEGAETQWDRKVIDAYFRCRERVHAIRQRGVGESLQKALVGALRNSGSSQNQVRIDLWQPFPDGPRRAAM
jgi:HD-GYP domain-containing protein (c-di-GMP phosphodiesterase class II)